MSSAFPRETGFAKAVSLVKSDPQVGEENRKLILEFADKCFADGLTPTRIRKLQPLIFRIRDKPNFNARRNPKGIMPTLRSDIVLELAAPELPKIKPDMARYLSSSQNQFRPSIRFT